ncbi:hypothetical protein HD806DRAFT_447943 [Xylariaceae sp. AK1471]|nr:hypothetical protein HD806DRAFT_447943 [Xylariaceae sp. AK1471]
MEQLRWERHMEESKLQKEIEMAKAEAAASELDAKLKATREMAFREAEKRMKEEFESRKMREAEARHQAEIETNKRIEAEKLAYEEAKAAEELKKQLRLQVEAELREKQEAEHKAREEAAKKIAEEDHREEVRKWATERAEKDLENENQIHLKDAVGRKIAIPFSQGRTWQGMEELIHAAFLHVDIVRPEVLAGHFDLIGPDGAIILPQVWDKTIQPGWTITMQMWPIAGPSGPGPSLPPTMPPPPGGPPIPAPHPPFPSSLPPRPAEIPNSEYVVVEEEEESDERLGMSDASSGYDTSMESSKPSRRARIASAFSSLKSTIFRRRRRHASLPSVISASVSESSVSESSAPSPRSSPRRSR